MIHQQDILEDILFRLPAKSICQFRCVSKQWRTLLSQPHFIKSHLNRIKRLPVDHEVSHLAVNYETRCLVCIKLKDVNNEITAFATNLMSLFCYIGWSWGTLVKFKGFCDGLTLFMVNGMLVLMNPTTKEHKYLPDVPCTCDPCFCTAYNSYGIGYDSVSDDYKVVTLTYVNGEHGMFVHIYSVKNGTWKVADKSPIDYYTNDVEGIFINGHIHWILQRASKKSKKSRVLVAFDLGEEKFHEVLLPSSICCGNMGAYKLSTLGDGCLCIYYSRPRDLTTNVWVLKEYGVEKSWTTFTIKECQNSVSVPIFLFGKEQVVVLKKFERRSRFDDELAMYNLKEGKHKEIVVEGIADSRYQFGVGGTFIESLVSPHCNHTEATT